MAREYFKNWLLVAISLVAWAAWFVAKLLFAQALRVMSAAWPGVAPGIATSATERTCSSSSELRGRRSSLRVRWHAARGPPNRNVARRDVVIPGTGESMLKEPTMEKMQAMRLRAMATAWNEQQQVADVVALPFDERLAMLIDAEWMARENKRLGRALKEAKLRIGEASIEGIDYGPRRELDKALVRQLGIGKWIMEHQTVLVTGATGTGKTYVACALAQQACRQGYRAMYRRSSRLFDELRLARADGSYPRVLARLARLDVLVIDDFAIAPVAESERRDLLEVLEDRYGVRATVIASQLAPERWHDYLGDPTVADAICDRVLHGAHRIALKGPSRRKEAKGTQDGK
jgi:DNA replication protein DnaC